MAFQNLQRFVILISNPKGQKWIIGTDSQREFTEKGAEKAERKLETHLPHGWKVEVMELVPIYQALVLKR